MSTSKETTELKNEVNTMQEWLTEAEGQISDLEDSTQQLVNAHKLHSKQADTLWSRVEDQENSSCRNNIRLLGLKEGSEGDNWIAWKDIVRGPTHAY